MSVVSNEHEISWLYLYQTLSQEDQVSLIRCWRDNLKKDKRLAGAWKYHVKKLAPHMRVRPQFIDRMPEEKLFNVFSHKAATIIKDLDLWGDLFRLFYFDHRTKLMCDFLDAVGLEHNEKGGIDKEGQEQPDALTYLQAIHHVIATEHSESDVQHYIQTLLLMDDGSEKSEWYHLHGAWSHYLESMPSDAAIQLEDNAQVDSIEDEQLLPKSELDQFTTIDEVVIRQIVAVTNGDLGALSGEKLDDMLQELIQLNTNRTRNYFHMGFAESLVFNRFPDFAAQPAMNDERKGWYLCGALAGCVRRRNDECFDQLLAKHGKILQRCLKKPGAVAVALCNYLFEYMADRGMHDQALPMLNMMISKLDEQPYVWKGLKVAETLLREDAPEQALKYLTILVPFIENSQNECPIKLFMRVKRRYGQAMQQLGQFKDAQICLYSIVVESEPKSPDILSDIALVKAGFKSIREVRLFSSTEQRVAILEALKRANTELMQAVSVSDGNAPNADYLLAVTNYLSFQKTNNEASRKQAVDYARSAVAAMRASESFDVYEEFGLFGSAQFIEVSMLAHASDEANLPKIKNKWVSISEHAGVFPDRDLAFFLDGLAFMDGATTAEIAESIWCFHKQRAWDILENSEALPIILVHAKPELLEKVYRLISDEKVSGERRFRIAQQLVDAARDRVIDDRLAEIVEEALDVIESLSLEDKRLGERFLSLMQDEFCDPFWSEEESLWARVQLARKIGDDRTCAQLLPDLFYRYRDIQTNLALQILEQCKTWKVDLDLIRQLKQALPIIPETVKAQTDLSAKQCETRPVKIIFVGGNEIQERYDDNVKKWLVNNIPNVHVQFEHTGWSSNWGRELDRILTRIEEADAVVLMQMMRTTLGRHLRKKSARPWIPCTGTGQGSIRMSIQEAEQVVRKQRRQNGKGACSGKRCLVLHGA